ncbi:Predicted arabinose efflux permease, MFS family [Thermomonospora echinospora]|uniref:Predicted arabinose efflux permease, MFS family n=1 Tax=Thermomonospora echinospora TaxID=1992 RepID=A0A1H6AIE6_9ACTN|nr:MFS transporter [Thermomonospora echinospora]SEG47934.1 Predicted arabinose efflux permease, MFS family [Thermomonospora echinospora]
MLSTLALARSFDRPVRLLLINQLTINTGFYMLMPYLAGHLSGNLGLSAALVGLVLGVRNLSQQGMFLIGGSLADRLGCKPMIVAGCALRTVAFLLLGVAGSVPVLIVASALTGLAGALFNPAVRAYLTHRAGDRKVEAFAAFNAFYQLGILIGPLIGLVLNGVAFRLVCLTAGLMFAVLTVAQIRALPAQAGGAAGTRRTMLADWREALANRAFLMFSAAMAGSYILNFQVYLGLPLEVRRTTASQAGVTAIFVISGVLTIAGQARVTGWAQRHWRPARAITWGLVLMAGAFVPVALAAPFLRTAATSPGWPAHLLALLPIMAAAALLTLATMIVYPFEMATITTLGGERMVGTYYGLYSTLSGVGIAAGNLLSGAALDAGRAIGMPGLPWLALTLTGVISALALYVLDRTNRLTPVPDLTTHPPENTAQPARPATGTG